MKISVIIASALAGMALLLFCIFLIYSSITAYKPKANEPLMMQNNKPADTIPAGKLELYTWNIGYAGLGKEMDFFYENGKNTRPPKEYYERCRDGIIYQLTTLNRLDFILLQEVDQQSDRTWGDNLVDRFKATFKDYSAAFANNYVVKFVPVPIKSPMGKVNSGMMTLSRFVPAEAIRVSLPSQFSWPKSIFMPSRCYLLTRYNVSNGKQLVIMNIHNTAGDSEPLRAKELAKISQAVKTEFAKGNYVIAGGDWNQNPPGFSTTGIADGNSAKAVEPAIASGLFPAGFTWAFDSKHPTNRDVDAPYTKGTTKTTIFDFFLLSPNIKLLTCNTLVNDFEFSDHQAVGMIVELQQ